MEKIKKSAKQILKDSERAKLIIYGCKAVITGPPNTGKSSLLNELAGKQKAIVTETKGTTRDYVTANCQMGELAVELIDTAGLDDGLIGSSGSIEDQSQQKSANLLKEADLVLLVLDNSQPAEQLDKMLCGKLAGKKVVTVLNKSDLAGRFDAEKLPDFLSKNVKISAKFGKNIEKLTEKIRWICDYEGLNLHACICVTSRQEDLLKKLIISESRQQATLIIEELLNGKVSF